MNASSADSKIPTDYYNLPMKGKVRILHVTDVHGQLNPVYFNSTAKEAVFWTQKQLSSEDIHFLSSLGLVFKGDDFILVHGTLSEPERFHYLVYVSQAHETFHLMDRPICFIGHSHASQIIVQQGGEDRCFDGLAVKTNPEHKYIVNVGSIGQPRDNDPRLCYAVYDTERSTVELKRLSYDIEKAQKKILDAGLPPFLAIYLKD